MNVKSVNHSNLLKSQQNNIFNYSIWKNLNILFLMVLFFLSIFFIFSFFTSHIQYQIVCNHLSSEDTMLIFYKLTQMKIPYRYIENSGELLVPEHDIPKVYAMLLSEGFPKPKNLGFELIDQEKFGMSPFNTQINYQRALEGELSRSIQKINAIKTAQVHIAFPQTVSVLKNSVLPSASVIISFKYGKHLNFMQCHAITDLIAASVPELLPKNVVILDDYGNYLNKKNTFIGNVNFLKYNIIQSLEKEYRQKVIYILEPILKLENFRVQIHVTKSYDILNDKKYFKFHNNTKFMVNNINNFLTSTFLNHMPLTRYFQKYNISVLVLINDLRNEKNQLKSLNSIQISKIKNLIVASIQSCDINLLDVKIINIKFYENMQKIVYYNSILYYFKNIPNYLLYTMFIFVILCIIQLLRLLKIRYIDYIVQKNHQNLHLKTSKIKYIHKNEDLTTSKKDLQEKEKYNESIKDIIKNNPKLIAMILKNWINKKK